MSKRVSELEGAELDAWVARALGHNVIGEAECYRDPECGALCISPRPDFLGPGVIRPVTLFDRRCPEEMAEDAIFEDVEQVLGYPYLCLHPVPEYSKDWNHGGPLIEQKNLLLMRAGQGTWFSAICKDVDPGGDPLREGSYSSGSTPLVAAMRAFVVSRFGDEVAAEGVDDEQ